MSTVAAAGISAATQASMASQAQQLQAQEAQSALDFQKQEFNTNETNQAPFLQAGQQAIGTLSGLVPQLNAAGAAYPSFTAPTAAQAQATPGYQFTLGQGEQAVQNSAAAKGGLLSGNTLNAEQQYGQGLADSTYQQTYNNALQGYQQNYNQFQNQQANTFNRYASLAGVGQTSANALGTTGQAAASNVANVNLTTGEQQGQQLNNIGAAQASGYVGAANAGGGLAQNYLLSQVLNQGAAGSVGANGNPLINTNGIDLGF